MTNTPTDVSFLELMITCIALTAVGRRCACDEAVVCTALEYEVPGIHAAYFE